MSPELLNALAIFLLSLIGVPLTGGFFGKFYIFKAAMEVYDGQLLWLVVIGVFEVVSVALILVLMAIIVGKLVFGGAPAGRGVTLDVFAPPPGTTPSSTAATELATESERFSWAWMPSSVAGSRTSR